MHAGQSNQNGRLQSAGRMVASPIKRTLVLIRQKVLKPYQHSPFISSKSTTPQYLPLLLTRVPSFDINQVVGWLALQNSLERLLAQSGRQLIVAESVSATRLAQFVSTFPWPTTLAHGADQHCCGQRVAGRLVDIVLSRSPPFDLQSPTDCMAQLCFAAVSCLAWP